MKKKMDFTTLETITTHQVNIYNQFLLYCAEKTTRQSSNSKDKKRRERQLNHCKKSIMPRFKYSIDFQKLVNQWWSDEIKWYKERQNYGQDQYALLYRLQLLFFKNYISCPFIIQTKRGNKLDNKEFCEENQKVFKRFLNQSIKIIFAQKKFQPIADILPLLKSLKDINIDEQAYSATHKLYGKDWHIAKGIAVGGKYGSSGQYIFRSNYRWLYWKFCGTLWSGSNQLWFSFFRRRFFSCWRFWYGWREHCARTRFWSF